MIYRAATVRELVRAKIIRWTRWLKPHSAPAKMRMRRSPISRWARRWKIPRGASTQAATWRTPSYGDLCAERVAVFKAISEGVRQFRRVAVVAYTGILPRCHAECAARSSGNSAAMWNW